MFQAKFRQYLKNRLAKKEFKTLSEETQRAYYGKNYYYTA